MLQRMLIEKIENRILVGILMFLGIMVLTAWVAINEPGRMAAFEQQHLARSIQWGAELYAANCSTCHGNEGYGILGRAPALNSPQLFGYDFFAGLNRQAERLNDTKNELARLQAELDSGNITRERQAEIQARIAALQATYGDDIVAGIDKRLAEIEQERQSLRMQMQPAIDKGYDPDNPDRLATLGWQGTLDVFLQTTLVHGRPTSESYWPQAMVAWSQRAGGPLRDDQIENLSNYIMNWNRKEWTIEDLLAVQQFPIRPGLPGAEMAQIEGVGTNVEAIMAQLEGVTGDPLNGQTIYNNPPLACAGCHSIEAVAPLTANQWNDIVNVRLNEPQFAGYTPEMYIVESIVNPGAYLVPGYGNAMPADFGQRIDIQMLADIIAYIKSYE
ncbi:MAG: c-type cytochrome [Aggregatilineales bacterium]